MTLHLLITKSFPKVSHFPKVISKGNNYITEEEASLTLPCADTFFLMSIYCI